MSESATTLDSPWLELLELSAEPGGERQFLERLLTHLCAATPISSAALYVRGEEGFCREMVSGSELFPETLDASTDPFECLDLGDPRLLYALASGSSWRLPPDLAVLAASGARSLLLRHQLKLRHFEVNYRGVELQALYDVGLAINSTLNLEELHAEILLRAVSLLDARRGALYVLHGEVYRLERTFGGEAWPKLTLGDPEVERLLERSTVDQPRVIAGASHILGMPIEVDGSPRGLLLVADKESRTGVGPFPPSDHRTLSLFATQAAIAIENAHLHRQALEKERLERELDLAADIQRGLLPKAIPVMQGYDFFGWSRPARHVGGDYYDLLPLADGDLGLVVADVSGKGMPAALLVSTLHSALRLLLDRWEPGPELLEKLNQHIFDSSASNRFITLLMVELEPGGDRLRYLNAGHNPALLVHFDGEVVPLTAGGLPIGLLADSRYRAKTVDSRPGDLLCIYSDGITECASPAGEEFGPGRLADLLRQQASRPLQEICETIEQATTRFADGLPQGDDQTILLMRRD